MQIADILTPSRTLCEVQAASKKRVLEDLSILFAKDMPNLSSKEVFQCLLAREKLGSTALGNGIAIPHARISNSGGIVISAFMHTQTPIDFDAPDNQPVDLFFALLVPDNNPTAVQQHLELLAEIAEMFSDKIFCEQLRQKDKSIDCFRALVRKEAYV
ncbi:MAG: PTS IIA-like nitrogen regulatory protein PtsN [Pseudomonadota bacterium]